MNISFLTSAHGPYDDRIYYHMAQSLVSDNQSVEIVSSRLERADFKDGIKLNCFSGDNLKKRNKIKQFVVRLEVFKPDIIICSEPLTILAAHNYSATQKRKVQIIYDVTEWYPSKKNLVGRTLPVQCFLFVQLLFFNLLVSRFTDSFIFGEWFKSRPYRILYPSRSYIFIPYFPRLTYIPYCRPEPESRKLRLSYSGKISREKGFGNFMNVIRKLSESDKKLNIEVTITGWFDNNRDKQEYEGQLKSDKPEITIHTFDKQDFQTYLNIVKNTDIFLDLRSDDIENQHCLPVKLFYYAAFGRPVIFTCLRAIKKEVETEKFGFLVKPDDSDKIAELISAYLANDGLYFQHCNNARTLAEKKYNWEKIEPGFINFITSNYDKVKLP